MPDTVDPAEPAAGPSGQDAERDVVSPEIVTPGSLDGGPSGSGLGGTGLGGTSFAGSGLTGPGPAEEEAGESADGGSPVPDVTSPAKVIRIGAMAKQLLEELRATDLDDPAREQLRTIYESSVDQLQEALSPDLADELERLAFVFGPDSTPTDAEIRLASAQLVGWLEGLFHGIQAMLVAQQVQAQQQLQGMRAQLAERSSPASGGPGYI